MGNDSKRKRGFVEIADSEDDEMPDPSPMARRTRNDEQVARRLQEEMDHEAAAALVSNDDQGQTDDDESPLSDIFSDTASEVKGKGKAVAHRSRTTRSAAKKVQPDDDEDEDAQDPLSEPVHSEPPTKKRNIRGKAKMPEPPRSDDDDDDEAPSRLRHRPD